MRYQHILWDFNGTILDDVAVGITCINRLLTRRNLPPLADKAAYQQVFDFPVEDYYRRVGLDLEAEPFAVLAVEWVKEYDAESPKAGLCDGVRALNAWFRGKGVKQTVFSATEINMLKRQLSELQIEDLFDDFVGLDNIHAAGKQQLAEDYLASEDTTLCLFIGDTVHDAQVARAVGADCILVASGHQKREQLIPCGFPVVDRLSEIPDLLTAQAKQK